MTALTVFYSWQSDQEAKLCRAFIETALQEAAALLKRERGLEVQIDADTRGVAGTPPVNQTILDKIDRCGIFLADMTFVAATGKGKLLPNPNVLVEYGYALKSKGLSRILLTMNTAFGPPDELPFDLRHLRYPQQFDLPLNVADAERRRRRSDLAVRLAQALATISDRAERETEQATDTVTRLKDLWIATLNARSVNRAPTLVSTPRLDLCVIPAAALGVPRLELTKVAALRSQLIESADLRVIEGQDEAQWFAHAPPIAVFGSPNPESSWSSRLLRPGIVEHHVTLGRRIDDNAEILVNGCHLEQRAVDRIDRSLTLLQGLGLAGPFFVGMALYGLEEVRLNAGHPLGRFNRPSLLLPEVVLPAGLDRSANCLRDSFDAVWLAGGRAEGSPSYGRGDWDGYAGGPPYD